MLQLVSILRATLILHSFTLQNWIRAPNCVAKRYKKPVPDSTYLDDVTLQMDSKALGKGHGGHWDCCTWLACQQSVALLKLNGQNATKCAQQAAAWCMSCNLRCNSIRTT